MIFIVGPAKADLLLGKVVNYTWYDWGLTGSPYPRGDNGNYTVGQGVVILNNVDNARTLDISDTTLYFDFTRAGSFPVQVQISMGS